MEKKKAKKWDVQVYDRECQLMIASTEVFSDYKLDAILEAGVFIGSQDLNWGGVCMRPDTGDDFQDDCDMIQLGRGENECFLKGKSEIMRQAANENGIPIVEHPMIKSDLDDLKGLPEIKE